MSFQPHDSPTGPSSSTYGSSDPHIQSATPLEEDDEKSDSDVDRNSDTMDNDDRDSQRDSAFEEDSLLGDDQASINSRISEYRMENGRRYHGYHDGSYWVRIEHCYFLESLYLLSERVRTTTSRTTRKT